MAVTVSLPRPLGWAPDNGTEWDESPVVCALRLQIKAASASQTKENVITKPIPDYGQSQDHGESRDE